jgi:hypothetical protein
VTSPGGTGSDSNPDVESGTTDEDREVTDVSQPLWERYEQDVAEFVASCDPNATVVHNKKIPGKQSGRTRQVDVLVTGTLGGHGISFAVECKRYKNPLGIGVVDEFAGKLADLGVEFGVMYSFSGFGQGATARAAGATQPKIELRGIPTPDVVLEPWAKRLSVFTGFGDCPNDNCMTGDITWQAWPQTDSAAVIEAGSCWVCGTWAVRCPDCEAETGVMWFEEVQCDGCENRFALITDHKGTEVEAVVVL